MKINRNRINQQLRKMHNVTLGRISNCHALKNHHIRISAIDSQGVFLRILLTPKNKILSLMRDNIKKDVTLQDIVINTLKKMYSQVSLISQETINISHRWESLGKLRFRKNKIEAFTKNSSALLSTEKVKIFEMLADHKRVKVKVSTESGEVFSIREAV